MSYVDPKINDAQEPFRSALAGLLAECGGRVRIGNAWRSTARQAVLYYNYTHHIGGQATAAKPGTSNHEFGLAADLEGDLPLAHSLAAKYGLHWPVPGENWHIEKIGVNRHTYPAPWSPGHDPVKRAWRGFGPGETDATIAAQGGMTNEVKEAQLLLAKLGYYKGKMDGDYGPISQDAVKRFKAKTIRDQKTQHKPVWPNADPVVGDKTIKMLRNVAAKAKG